MNRYEQQHRQLVRQLAPECAVLLRSNGDFPLNSPCALALYGSGARRTVMGGTGSGEVNTRTFVTAEEGLRAAGFTVTTAAWLDGYDRVAAEAKKDFIRAIRARAKKNRTLAVMEGMGAVMPAPDYELPLSGAGDTAVYVLSRISGEGSDRAGARGDILLSRTEEREILAIRRRYKRFMLVLNVGGPVDLSPLDEVENILLLSQLGIDTGTVLADLLLGRAYPSGKLATTWTAWEDYPRLGTFGDKRDTYYTEGVYVGYRYFSTAGKRPMFPFGFGLGYTSFSADFLSVHGEGERITVRVMAGNTGRRPGRETVQLYVTVPGETVNAPFLALAAWQKTRELAPGEREELTLRFDLSELASFREEERCFALEKGDYVLRLGTNSADTIPCALARLTGDAVTFKVEKNVGRVTVRDAIPGRHREEPLPAELPVVEIAPDSIPCREAAYDREWPVEEAVRALTDEELAFANTGAFDPHAGLLGFVGAASSSVPGAAGETTSRLRDRGFPVLVMADGPAGLRLNRRYALDEKGAHGLEPTLPESMAELLPPAARALSRVLGRPRVGKNARIVEQYATAIPIGTAIAQSWNEELARQLGDLVGAEMECFGVHLWLAPALNIHRDIRCGRNFEYFSEDPLLTGKMAAALTKGVQAHPGRGVTIKHYAANNQETNRYGSCSHVSERALREIYLRGFGICVREAAPAAVMTSYNLINGVHSSESRALTENILRCEFGFEGLVMTDWLTGAILADREGYGPPAAGRIAAAGGDLVMPGSMADVKDILAALKNGTLKRRQLEINASRLLRAARKLTAK